MHSLRPLCLILLGWLMPVANAQDWLTAPSMQPTEQLPLPTLPAEGLFEPPPPLEPLPPSVFDDPLDSQVEPSGSAWLYPWRWIPLDGWQNSAELGLNGSAGNTESTSFQTGSRLKRKTEWTLLDLRLTYNRTHANGIETQNNALLYTDFERFFGDSPWTYFIKNGLEYDEFRMFDLRYNINTGFGYRIFRSDDLTLTGRFGAGASREFGGPDDNWKPEALFGIDYEHQVNERNKLIARIDYFPEWSNFANFRMVSDFAWEYLLDPEGNLSFKLGATDRYDSTPFGAKPNDINYSALVLYKF